jgi:TonB family protein
MIRILKVAPVFLTILFCLMIAMSASCQSPPSPQDEHDENPGQENLESKQTEKETSNTPNCLTIEFPKLAWKPVYAGVLNAKAIDIPKPIYPSEAKLKKITGNVKARVLVDETGKVVWAKVEGKSKMLRKAVEKVVCSARFKSPTISGRPVPFTGDIMYKFVLPSEKAVSDL